MKPTRHEVIAKVQRGAVTKKEVIVLEKHADRAFLLVPLSDSADLRVEINPSKLRHRSEEISGAEFFYPEDVKVPNDPPPHTAA